MKMSNYSYSELQNMQKRAMERVREMQRNSDSVLETAQRELGETVPTEQNSRKNYENVQKPRMKTKITNMPPNFPENKQYPDFKEYFAENREPHQEQKQTSAQSGSNILETVLAEPDRALLLGLLLLLKSEGADEALMMALMYIMA